MYLGDTGQRTLFSVETINSRNVRAHSHFVSEDEVLLLPGTQMIVQSQFCPAPDLHIIHLKQVVPEEILLELPFESAHLYPKTQRRSWYHQKRFVIPLCLLITLLIMATILGSVFGARSAKSVCYRPFEASKRYLVGSNPSSAALGHFRNEIDIDVAVANLGSDSITILFGDASGTFQQPWTYTVGRGPSSVISNDFNSDKKMDLVVANGYSNTISVLLGSGDGSFESPGNYTAGRGPVSVISADFNNDNKLDIAVVNVDDATVSLLLGDNAGTFLSQSTYATGINSSFVTSADLNNDKKLDLVVTNSASDDLYVLFNICN